MTRFMPDAWALPAVDDRNRPFFASGKLLLQVCAGCGTVQHPPEDVCHTCQGMTFETRESKGIGKVYSFTVVRHPVHPLLVDKVPYAVALVALGDYPHVRVTGNILNVPPERIAVGMPVRAVWEEIADESGERLLLPQWEAVT